MELLGSYPTAALTSLPFTFIQSWDPGTPWITVSKHSGVPRGRVRNGGQRLLSWQLLPHSFSFQKNVYLFCYLGSACLWTWQMLCQIGSLISVHVDDNFCQPEKLHWASSDEELRFATVCLPFEVPSSLPDHRAQKKREINNNQRRHGSLHEGASTLACGLEQCNQAWKVSLGLQCLIVGMLDFWKSARDSGFMSLSLVHFVYEGKKSKSIYK